MSGLYDYLALTLDMAVTAYLISAHWRDSKTINNIKNAPTVDVGQNLMTLMDDYPNGVLPYAVVRGCVTDVKGTVESSTGMKGVIQIITVHEITPKRFGDCWDVQNIPPINEHRNSVPFALKPISNSTSSSKFLVEVENPFDSIWENLLLPCSSYFTPSNSSVTSAGMGGIGTSKVLGVRKTEKFLPIGTIVTGVGKVVLDAKNGNLKLQAPPEEGGCIPYMLTTLPVEDLIAKLQLRRNIQRVIIGMTLSFGMLIIGRRIYKMWKCYKMKALRDHLVRERRNINLDDLCRCQTCLVCLVNPREVIILNCGHVCVCADCILKLNGHCPVCRERISSTHKAYII